MTTTDPAARFPDVQQLGMRCLSHLEQEEALLAATLKLLREIRSALIGRELERLSAGLQQQQHTAKAAAELSRVREQLRVSIATMLSVPVEQATLSVLAARLPAGLQDQLLNCRRRLAAMAAEVAAINCGNAMLIRQSMAMLGQLLSCFTGTKHASERYAPDGQLQRNDLGSTFQTDC